MLKKRNQMRKLMALEEERTMEDEKKKNEAAVTIQRKWREHQKETLSDINKTVNKALM